MENEVKHNSNEDISNFFKNPITLIVVALILLFFIMVIIPQSFWVDISMKLFK